MMICPTLRTVQRKYVPFDPTNVEHLEAAKSLCLGVPNNGSIVLKQHPTLRFELEQPYGDVRTMMFHKMIEHHIAAVDVPAVNG